MQGETFKLNQNTDCLQICPAASEHLFFLLIKGSV